MMTGAKGVNTWPYQTYIRPKKKQIACDIGPNEAGRPVFLNDFLKIMSMCVYACVCVCMIFLGNWEKEASNATV